MSEKQELTVGDLLDHPQTALPGVLALDRAYIKTILKIVCSTAPAIQREPGEDPATVAGKLIRTVAWLTQRHRNVSDLQAAILAYRSEGGDLLVLLQAAKDNTDPIAADFINFLRSDVLPMAVRFGFVPAGLL